MVPLITDRSLWQTPAAPMATRTSVGPGSPTLSWSVTSTSSPVYTMPRMASLPLFSTDRNVIERLLIGALSGH